MALNQLAFTQPANQRPTGNLSMAPNGTTYNPAPSGGTFLPPVVSPPKTVTNTTVAPTSTTTLSNTNKINAIPTIISKTNNLSDKGVRTDQNSGISTLANGQVAPDPEKRDSNGLLINPPGALYDRNTGKPLNQPKEKANPYQEIPSVENDTAFEDKQIMDNLDRLQAMSDAATADLLANIKQKYAQRKIEQAEANVRANKSTLNSLLMGGVTGQGSSMQYAPISSEGIVSLQENFGIKKLAELDSEENDLIAEAKQAQINNNFKILEYKNKEIETIRDKKIAVAKELNAVISKRNEEDRKRSEEVDRENNIGEIYSQGITDTTDVLKELQKRGVKATTKEVADTIGLLSGIGGSGIVGEYNFYKAEALRSGQVPISFNAYQDMDANRKKSIARAGVGTGSGSGGGIYDQLDYRTANAVIAQGNQFGTSDVVKKYNNMIAASNLIAGVDPYTTNPAEHQAVIYNFAKALDPDSVVREGEYATVKKYSQSLVQKYGGEIKQAIKGKGFLSAAAIKAIQEATDNRIKAYEPQYKNLRNETARRINTIAGKDVADTVLLDYDQGYTGNTADSLIKSADQAKSAVDTFVDNNPNDPDITAIVNFYKAGKNDNDIYEWLKLRGKIKN